MKKSYKKYSLDDRRKYHNGIVGKSIDKCTTRNGFFTKIDYDKLDKMIDKSPRLQYSFGFTSSKNEDLSGASPSYIQGYNAARKAEEKSRTIKF